LRERLGNPENCVSTEPELREVKPGQFAACHWSEEITPEAVEGATRATDRVATAEPAGG
jgi:hypothetical protein